MKAGEFIGKAMVLAVTGMVILLVIMLILNR
jgi:hypothetical protein